MSFLKSEDMKQTALQAFEKNEVKLLRVMDKLIREAAEAGRVSVALNPYKPEYKDIEVSTRKSLIAYLRTNGFKADVSGSNELVVEWGQ